MVEQLPEEYIVKIDSVLEGDIVMLKIYDQENYYSNLYDNLEMNETNSHIFISKIFNKNHIFSEKLVLEKPEYTIYSFENWFKIINFKETTIKTIL